MRDFSFCTRKTRVALSLLDVSKSSGPDGIPVHVLKQCAPELAPILTKFFQKCYDTGICPSSWKEAHVVPVPKKGDPTNPSNYRPISITSILCKVMETLFCKHLLEFLENNNLINDRQYDFRKARSTGDMLAYVTELWSSTLDKGGEFPIISLDISKAFDRVWHKALISKMSNLGINPVFVAWVANFLSGRCITVGIDGVISDKHAIQAGVPQDSILAPGLFLIFISMN